MARTIAKYAGSMVVAAPSRSTRLDSLDLLRGFVMVVMALDHVRDFWSNAKFDPTDLGQTTPSLFATRWVTHLCAPTFMLLVGTGAYLSRQRGMSKHALARFLLTRGLWMIVLEFTVVKLGWRLSSFGLHDYTLLVLWALGWSMIALAGLIYLPLWAIGAISGLIVVGHNALDGVSPGDVDAFGKLWTVLHVQGPLTSEGSTWDVFVAYPLIPWIGVTGLGYVFGAALVADPQRRRRIIAMLGGALLLAFVVLRAFDVYGEPEPWHHGPDAATTVMSFINLTKYPPSLLYLCATLGISMLLLAAFERLRGPVASFFITFGRVPMFFYLLHIPLIHGAADIAYGGERQMFSRDPRGVDLWLVYVVWAATIVALYPLCRWYEGVKARSRSPWLRYI
jgi:uncharacterized membrane protein